MWVNVSGEEVKRKTTVRWQHKVATGEFRKQRYFNALSVTVMRLSKARCRPDRLAANLVWRLWLDSQGGAVWPEQVAVYI